MTNRKPLLTLALLTLASPALAQDEAEAPGFEPSITISGFVDTSVYMPITGFPAAGDEVTFGVDQVEVDFEAMPAEGLTLRTDLQVFPSASFSTADPELFIFDNLLEQGYIDYETSGGYFVRAGKANAPIGAEGIDPVDLYQYSQGQLFTSATPSNLTGLFTGYRGDKFSAQVWVTNDWDLPGTPRSATPGLRLELPFSAGHVGLSSTFGPVVSDDPYLMVDVDTALSFGDLTILGEVNFGTSDALETVGFLATLSYAINDWVAATLRGDYLMQTMTETVGGVTAEVESNAASITGAGLFTLADNFGAVVELRADLPEGSDPAVAGAFELLAWW